MLELNPHTWSFVVGPIRTLCHWCESTGRLCLEEQFFIIFLPFDVDKWKIFRDNQK